MEQIFKVLIEDIQGELDIILSFPIDTKYHSIFFFEYHLSKAYTLSWFSEKKFYNYSKEWKYYFCFQFFDNYIGKK